MVRKLLIESNVVVVSPQFDLSVINNVWLLKKGIFKIDEIQESSQPIPMIIEMRSKDFLFALDPNRLQFWITPGCDKANELLASKVAKFVEQLPEQRYIAVGFNFIYHLLSERADIGKLTRTLFCQSGSPLFQLFDTPDARFGGYFSKDIIGTRLRLEAKPILLPQKENTEERLQFNFNFNINIPSEEDYQLILEFLKKWDDAKKITSDIMNQIGDNYDDK